MEAGACDPSVVNRCIAGEKQSGGRDARRFAFAQMIAAYESKYSANSYGCGRSRIALTSLLIL